ncbi:MAG: type transport system permease protein [Actinomycetota bacterium]|nr:type transport system permease protein [Actinomycetota bacterium]
MTAPPPHPLTATLPLTRLALRQDRARLTVWILGQSAFTALITAMSTAMPPHELLTETRFMADNPGMRLTGLANGATAGAYTMVRGYLTLAVLTALLTILTVVRHTRRSEDLGRHELLTSCPVGRHAPTAAALLVALLADLALTALTALALTTAGLPAAPSLTAALALGAVGLAFAGVAALTSQAAPTARTANALATAALALAVLTCGIGNMAGQVTADGTHVDSAWPVWLSPLGWGQQMRPFDGERLAPLVLAAVFFLVCTGAAVLLATRRDLGRGLLPARPGPARASRFLRGPTGLALRVHRGTILAWAVATTLFGLVLGAASEQVDDLTGSSREWYVRLGGTDDLHAAFQSSLVQMAGMLVAAHTVQILLRLRGEEAAGHLENILTAAVSRARWAGGHLLVAALSATLQLSLFALALGTAEAGVRAVPPGNTLTLLGACLTQLPSCLLLGAAVTALVALRPRLAPTLSWALLSVFLLIGPLFGPDLALPTLVQDLSPFAHLPRAPAEPFAPPALLGLLAASATLTALALRALRRRDLIQAG